MKNPTHAPKCQTSGCTRRADLAYRRQDGSPAYRTKCKVCRHGWAVERRPRPYAPLGQSWPLEEKCPYCARRREPYEGGHRLRRTCKMHRGQWRKDHPIPKKPAWRTRVLHHVATRPVPFTPPVKAKVQDPMVVTYREWKHIETVRLTPQDYRRLKVLYKEDVGIYPASTDAQLTRRYPTAAVTALFSRWAKGLK